MSTENMPTTNQGPEDATIADKIPPTLAAGFQKAASAAGNAMVAAVKQTVSAGISAS